MGSRTLGGKFLTMHTAVSRLLLAGVHDPDGEALGVALHLLEAAVEAAEAAAAAQAAGSALVDEADDDEV